MRFGRGYHWQLFVPHAILILGLFITILWVVASQVRGAYDHAMEEALRTEALMGARLLASALKANTLAEAESELRELGSQIDTRLTVIRADGIVLLDTDEDPAGMENHAGRPEIGQARERGTGVAVRFSKTVKKNLMYVAVREAGPGGFDGYIRAAYPVTEIEALMNTLTRRMVEASILLLLAGWMVAYWLAQRRAAPMVAMAKTADALAGGDLTARADFFQEHELGRLASSLNRMAGSLDQSFSALRAEKTLLETMLAGLQEAVAVIDREGKVVRANTPLDRLCAESPIGKHHWEILQSAALADLFEAVVKGEKGQTSEIGLGGRPERIYVARLEPAAGGAPGVSPFVLSISDITDLRNLERTKADFVTNVSHQLRTPLTGIKGYVETLLEDAELSGEARHRFLEIIARHTDRLIEIIRDLLTLSRIETSRDRRHEAVALRPAVKNALDLLMRGIEEKKIQMDVTIPDDLPPVSGDAFELEQLAFNLLDNAVRYNRAGGRIKVGGATRGDKVLLTIADTGIGIAAEQLPRVFERFYRASPSAKGERAGTGLGLSIVKHIVQNHGGHISVESVLGVGTTFTVELPAAG